MPARVNIGGVDVVLRAPPIFQGITEFNTGIRQGNPSNDDRNLASFVTLEDARAGIGLYKADVREDPDKLWDNEGLVTSKFGQLFLPPILVDTQDIVITPPARMAALESDIVNNTRMFFTHGNQLYFTDSRPELITAVSGTASITNILQLVEFRDSSGVRQLVMLGVSGAGAPMDIVTTPDPDASPTFTTQLTPSPAMTAIEFDGKLFLGGAGTLEWTITLTTVGAVMAGEWPSRWRFIGIFPYGETFLPYAIVDPDTSNASLVAVDVDANQLRPIDLGQVGGVVEAFAFEGQICIIASDGKEAFLYDAFNRTLRDLDWLAARRDTFPPHRAYKAIGGFPGPAGLVLVGLGDLGTTQLFQFRQTGWHPIGRSTSGTGILGGHLHASHVDRFVFFIDKQDAGTDVRLCHISSERESFIPGLPFNEERETTTLHAVTPWFNGGFDDLRGSLLALQSSGWFGDDVDDSSEPFTVHYQTEATLPVRPRTHGTDQADNALGSVQSTGRVVGDWIVAGLTVIAGSTVTPIDSGWTTVIDDVHVTSGERHWVGYRQVQVGDPSTYDFTLGASGVWLSAWASIANSSGLGVSVAAIDQASSAAFAYDDLGTLAGISDEAYLVQLILTTNLASTTLPAAVPRYAKLGEANDGPSDQRIAILGRTFRDVYNGTGSERNVAHLHRSPVAGYSYSTALLAFTPTNTWISAGSFPATASAAAEIWNRSEKVVGNDVLLIGSDLAGVSFNRFRLLITVPNSGSGSTFTSPNPYPLSARFIKRPHLRDSIRLEVDVPATVASNRDIDSINDLVSALRDVYIQDTIPLLRFYTDDVVDGVTWALMTSFPRVLDWSGSPHESDVAQDQQISEASMVLTFAEPL